jgi:hypothetical protein
MDCLDLGAACFFLDCNILHHAFHREKTNYVGGGQYSVFVNAILYASGKHKGYKKNYNFLLRLYNFAKTGK